jgi:hypothetical protein
MSEKIKTEIVYSRNPMKDLDEINERKMKKLGRNLKEEEKWNALIIISPFLSETDARNFEESWKKKSRGIQSRMKKGCKLAGSMRLEVYVNSNSKEKKLARCYWLAANKKGTKKGKEGKTQN